MIAEKVMQTNIHTREPAHTAADALGLCRKQNPVTDSRQKRGGLVTDRDAKKAHPFSLNTMELKKTFQKPVRSLRKNNDQKFLVLRLRTMNRVHVIHDLKAENEDVLWPNMPGVRL